ncbi:MAG: ATP-binding protein [Sphingomonadales bacterium]
MIHINNLACHRLGLIQADVVGQNLFQIIPTLIGTPHEQFCVEAMESGVRREMTAEFAPFEGVFHTIAQRVDDEFHVFFNDVTHLVMERRQAEDNAAELGQTKALLAVILDGLREGIVACDVTGKVVYANKAADDMLGYSAVGGDEDHREKTVNPLYEDGITPVPRDQAPLVRALRGENVDATIQWITTEGDRRTLINVSATPLRDPSGRVGGAVAWFRDVTLLRHQQQMLAESERKYRDQVDLFRRAIDGLHEKGLVVFDRSSNVMIANKYARTFLGARPEGRPRDELVSQYSQIDPASGRVMRPDEYASSLAMRGTPVIERQILVRGGDLPEDVWLVDSAVPLYDDANDISGAILWFRDITAAKKLEQERNDLVRRLAQAQKMEAIGQLAGGIAHDFNNLLTVILGNAEALLDEAADSPELRAYGEMISAAGMKSAELTHRLLAFSRQQPLEPKQVNVAELITGLDVLLRRALGEAIDIRVDNAIGLLPAIVDPGQLENAIINLAVNARDAMPEGGHLTIETSNVVLDNDYSDQHPDVRPGDYVSISVSDTGIGMPQEVIDRVFEPFFTTKEVGKGTGLGLSMVYGFIKQSGGNVRIYSEVGSGTTITLLIPRAAAGDTAARQTATSINSLPHGTERIAVVEDDSMVRSLVEVILSGLGYAVSAFETGAEILAEMESGSAFDLLLTDVVLPGGMSGRVVADQATGMNPGLKVLYMSGYTENAIVHHGRLDEGIHLLHKPFQRADLARKVRQRLDEQ